MTDQCLEKECSITAKGHYPDTTIITGFINMGADVTRPSQLFWPQSWPLPLAGFGIMGLSGSATGSLSAIVINVKNAYGQQANIRPYVSNAPCNLWG